MGRRFRFTQTNSTPFAGLDGTVIFGDGNDSTDKILLLGATGLGMDGLQTQTQKAPFQQGASMIRTLFDTRIITLECAIAVPGANSSGATEVTGIKRSLSKRLSPVGMGFMPDTSLLSSNYSTYTGQLAYAFDGVTYDRFIDAVPMKVEYPNAYYRDGFQKMLVKFFCPDPFWYGAEQNHTMTAVPSGVQGFWESIAYSPELKRFCAVASVGPNYVATSEDGILWTARTAAENNQWKGVAWSPTFMVFCAIASSGINQVMTSPDGITWTPVATNGGAWSCITWSQELGIFITMKAAASQDVQISSDGGASWTAYTSSGNHSWVSIAWSKELLRFCAVAQSGHVQTSPDGQVWTNRTPSAANSWESVCWSNVKSLFVAVASTGTDRVMTSPTGETWTARTASSANQWLSVIWSGDLGLFVSISAAVGTEVMTSPDSITWTTHAGVLGGWKALADGAGSVIAVSNNSSEYPMLSYDGTNWVSSIATSYYHEADNDGDVPTPFQLSIPVAGGETGKVIAIGDNFLWSGNGTPPSDHNMVFKTDGLVLGPVVVDTSFGSKTITQFGESVLQKFVSGDFFSLYVSGTMTNVVYVRNTGVNAGPPTIRWKNRYITV